MQRSTALLKQAISSWGAPLPLLMNPLQVHHHWSTLSLSLFISKQRKFVNDATVEWVKWERGNIADNLGRGGGEVGHAHSREKALKT